MEVIVLMSKRPTAEELYLYRMNSPQISMARKSEIAKFTKLYPHNNNSADKFEGYIDLAWEKIKHLL
jgi:hypothetical protein